MAWPAPIVREANLDWSTDLLPSLRSPGMTKESAAPQNPAILLRPQRA